MYEVVTAETDRGIDAFAEVMAHSDDADIESVPPAWARALIVDGVSVSYLLMDPGRTMAFPHGCLPYAFMEDAATREDRRGEGHFRRLLDDTRVMLRQAGLALLVTHGRAPLYRRLRFAPFTHHCGLFCTVAQIEARLGRGVAPQPTVAMRVEESRHLRPGLLLISAVEAPTAHEAAAALARERGKEEILFEDPTAPSYGSSYPVHATVETPLAALVRACGGEQRITSSAPEGRPVPHADWAMALDAQALVAQVLPLLAAPEEPLPVLDVSLRTDVGDVLLHSDGRTLSVAPGAPSGATVVPWSAGALAQLVTGYLPVDTLAATHGIELSPEEACLLGRAFPPMWRLSRNESWAFTS